MLASQPSKQTDILVAPQQYVKNMAIWYYNYGLAWLASHASSCSWLKQGHGDPRMDGVLSQPDGAKVQDERAPQRAAALVLARLSVVFLISLFYSPSDTGYISIWMFKNLTGLPCPACGLTHSFCALAKGRLTDAFGYNALGPVIFLLAVSFWLRSVAVLLGKTAPVLTLDRLARRVMLARLLLIGLGVYGLGRIVYIVTFEPQLIGSGPLLKLITALIH